MDADTSQTLADPLRQAILDCEKTAYVVAIGAGVSPGILSRFLRGQRGITLETASKICAYLGLELKPISSREQDAA